MDHEKIDLDGLIAAVETELPHIEHYLDLRSGKVLTVVNTEPPNDGREVDLIAQGNLVLSHRIHDEPEAYERIPSVATVVGLDWMKEWSETVSDIELRERLKMILGDCNSNCFKAFRRELSRLDEAERERWFAFREEKLQRFVDDWIRGAGPKLEGHAEKIGHGFAGIKRRLTASE
jgi:hypothetical protein